MTVAEATWRAAIVSRWIARVLGMLATLFFLAFLVGEGPPPLLHMNLQQNLQFLGMCGLCVGLVVAWKWEGWGGLIGLAAYTLLLIIDPHFNRTTIFAFPAAVALLHILCWARLAAGQTTPAARWGVPKTALQVAAVLTGIFILLCANEILLNPPLMTPALRPSPDLAGRWHGYTPNRDRVELQIGTDATVSCRIGASTLHGQIFNDRSWFGNLMNWRDPYVVRGDFSAVITPRDQRLIILIETEQNRYRLRLQKQ